MFQHFMHEGPGAWRQFGGERGHCHPFAKFGGGRHGHFERFFAAGGGGRERMFDGGDLQLIILSLLAEKPSYGYELIKAIEERIGGGYAPSPGVVYPTLTLLEERGFARIESAEGSRKIYGVTELGRAELVANADRLRDLTERFTENREHSDWGLSKRIRGAFLELRQAVLLSALRNREAGRKMTDEQINKVVEAMQDAARKIREL